MRLPPAVPILAALALAAHAAHTVLGPAGGTLGALLGEWLYLALMLGAAGAVLARGVLVRADRPVWLLFGAGALAWTAGDLYSTLVLTGQAEPPFPAPSDALFLAWYPLCAAALAVLVRTHVGELSRSLALDALCGALAVSAVAAAVLYDAVSVTISGDALAVAATLAYPVGDVVLLGAVVGVLALTGWRPGTTWALIGAGVALAAWGDAAYLVRLADGTYAEGTLLDAVWPASLLLLAAAAWRPTRVAALRLDGRLILFMPTLFGLSAVALVAVDQVAPLNPLAVGLACATLAVLVLRTRVTLGEDLRMVAASRGQAETDSLTGLGNRRKLDAALDDALAAARTGAPRLVALYDLDGFKRYNDTFGHLAGDALLARLGAKLAAAAAPHGEAFRLGGDEFCVVATAGAADREALLAATSAALAESGDGFAITTSTGAVLLPAEAADAAGALRLADERMYACKDRRVRTLHAVHAALRPAPPVLTPAAGAVATSLTESPHHP